MKHSLQLRLSQHLTLTPQLQQSIRLLQLSTLELNQELERILQDNPLLERDDGFREQPVPAMDPAAGAPETDSAPAADPMPAERWRERLSASRDRARRAQLAGRRARLPATATMPRTANTSRSPPTPPPCARTCWGSSRSPTSPSATSGWSRC